MYPCPYLTEFRALSGTIKSPGYEQNRYPPRALIVYDFTAPQDKVRYIYMNVVVIILVAISLCLR